MAATETGQEVNPINPVLYRLLKHKFGEVRISCAGVPARIEKIENPQRPGRYITRGSEWGEYYTICCPFCNDVAFKLWVNHMYGNEYDPTVGHRTNTHLAVCYKNGCLSVPGRYEQFEDLVFGPGKRILSKMAIRNVPVEYVVPKNTEPPGRIMSFEELPDYHPAAEYLASRNFDAKQLSRDFNVGVCVEPKSRELGIMRGRIYIPIYFNGQLSGWQGRTVGDRKSSVKYYNGMKRNQVLYNYDVARQQPVVVVVEGVPSVWRLWPAGVCIFGKTLSTWQLNTIATTWIGKPVFFMLDNNAQQEMDAGVEKLVQHGANVVPVILPDERDPADYTRAQLFELLSAAADAVEVTADLSFLA
jgi:hypothetical protein